MIDKTQVNYLNDLHFRESKSKTKNYLLFIVIQHNSLNFSLARDNVTDSIKNLHR